MYLKMTKMIGVSTTVPNPKLLHPCIVPWNFGLSPDNLEQYHRDESEKVDGTVSPPGLTDDTAGSQFNGIINTFVIMFTDWINAAN